MKQSIAVLSLFLGLSSQHMLGAQEGFHSSDIEQQIIDERIKIESLKYKYNQLENKYENLAAQLKKQQKNKKFAEGYGENEPVGETIRVKETGKLMPVKFNQKSGRFAEGYGEGEELGETIRVHESGKLQPVKFTQKSDKFAEGYGQGEELGETIRVHESGKLQPVKFSQKSFADGYEKGEELGETIRVYESGKLQPVKFSQLEEAPAPAPAVGVRFVLAGPKGPGLPERPKNNKPLKKPRGEKQWQAWAQDLNDWSDKQTKAAQTRIPYKSTLQLDADTEFFSLAGKFGPGLPPYPQNNQPLKKPRGEKQWQAWAQDHVNWLDRQTNAANTRIPYKSNLQLESDIDLDKFSLAGSKGPGLPPFPKNNAPLKNPRGEKQWQAWAQNLNDWSDRQTKAAQTRIPYHSNLQLDSEINIDKKKIGFSLAGSKGPGLPTYPYGNAPLKRPRGEKQWQSWAQNHVNWLDRQTNAANTRIPYRSTLQLEDDLSPISDDLIQINDSDDIDDEAIHQTAEEQDYENQQEEEQPSQGEPSEQEESNDEEEQEESAEEEFAEDDQQGNSLAQVDFGLDDIEKFERNDVPLDAKFLQDNEDEIVKIEDPNSVPLNFRFIQLEDQN